MGWSGYLKHEFFFSWPNVAVMVEYLWETAANISSMCNSLREKFLQLFVRRSFGYSPDISGFFSGHSTLNVTNKRKASLSFRWTFCLTIRELCLMRLMDFAWCDEY